MWYALLVQNVLRWIHRRFIYGAYPNLCFWCVRIFAQKFPCSDSCAVRSGKCGITSFVLRYRRMSFRVTHFTSLPPACSKFCPGKQPRSQQNFALHALCAWTAHGKVYTCHDAMMFNCYFHAILETWFKSLSYILILTLNICPPSQYLFLFCFVFCFLFCFVDGDRASVSIIYLM